MEILSKVVHLQKPIQVISLLDPEDNILYQRVSLKTKNLARYAIKTLEGINVKVPLNVRKKANIIIEQKEIHYEPRPEESLVVFWNIIEGFHELRTLAFRINNKKVRIKLLKEIHSWEALVLDPLHQA